MDFYNDIERYGSRIAVITDSGKSYSYKELAEAADASAVAVPPRSLVFLVCENCFESIAAYIGFLRKRAVPVLVNPKIDDEMKSVLLEKYRPQYIFCPSGWIKCDDSVFRLNDHVLIATENAELHPMDAELAVMITTSGSTGSPKLVMQSYKNISSNAGSIAEYLEIRSDDRAITTMPMSYTYGLSIIQSHLLMGAAVIATEKTLMDKGFWSLMKEQGATTFGGVPYIYEMLKRLRFGRMDIPSLRYITQAGGKLSRELALEFSEICRDKGIKLIVMYGQTEATARMAYLPWEYAFSKAGSMGIPIPGGRMRLIGDDGAEITQPDIVGELIYEGENVTLGYALSWSDLANGDSRNGILYTGDMAKRDADGFYTIVGRKKRFLKLFGNRVNLDEAEAMLNKEGYKCVCAGRDDLMKIYIEQCDAAASKNATEYISGRLGLHHSAFKTIAIDTIPRSESGKVMYSKLEELYG
ncbi:MAG: AMP-binding protein [Oscillospiraceae bacterium]|nr:AMP-binding protein [Oscillospiraceae bacterium]